MKYSTGLERSSGRSDDRQHSSVADLVYDQNISDSDLQRDRICSNFTQKTIENGRANLIKPFLDGLCGHSKPLDFYSVSTRVSPYPAQKRTRYLVV